MLPGPHLPTASSYALHSPHWHPRQAHPVPRSVHGSLGGVRQSSRGMKGAGKLFLEAPLLTPDPAANPTFNIRPSLQYGENHGEILPRPLREGEREVSGLQSSAHRAPPRPNRLPPSQGPAHRLRPRGLNRAPPWRLLWGRDPTLAPGCPLRPPRSVELIPGKLVLLGSTWKQRPSPPKISVLISSSRPLAGRNAKAAFLGFPAEGS